MEQTQEQTMWLIDVKLKAWRETKVESSEGRAPGKKEILLPLSKGAALLKRNGAPLL